MNALFKGLVKQFLPEIREKAAPAIEEALLGILADQSNDLMDDEERADIMNENVRGSVIVYICALTRDNKVTRFLKKYELPELVELLLSNLDKI